MSSQPGLSSTAAEVPFEDPAYSAQGSNRAADPQFSTAAFADEVATNGTAGSNNILPIPNELYPFPTPAVDLSDDWGWLQQTSLPTFSIGSDQIGATSRSNEIHDLVRIVRSLEIL